jgi:hypothetical protein
MKILIQSSTYFYWLKYSLDSSAPDKSKKSIRGGEGKRRGEGRGEE